MCRGPVAAVPGEFSAVNFDAESAGVHAIDEYGEPLLREIELPLKGAPNHLQFPTGSQLAWIFNAIDLR